MADWKKLPDVAPAPAQNWKSLPDAAPVAPALPEGGTGWFEPGSTSGAMLRGFGQGASYGFSDELNGAVMGLVSGFGREGVDLLKSGPGRALMRRYASLPAAVPDAAVDAMIEHAAQQSAKDTLGMKSLPTTGSDPDAALRAGYRHGRDTARLENVQAQKAAPATYITSGIAGGIAAPGPKLPPGAKGLAKFEGVAKIGGLSGALGAAGLSNADLLRDETGALATDVAEGGAYGAALAPAMSLAGEKAAPAIKRLSQSAALRAMGLRAGISDQLQKRGYETADDARQLGQAALDMELIRPFRTATDVAERAGFARETQGARIEQALADADIAAEAQRNAMSRQFTSPTLGKMGPSTPNLPPNFDTERAAWQAAGEVMGPEGLSPTAIRNSRNAQRIVGDIAGMPNVQEPTFANANKMKSDIYAGINYATDPTLKTTMERRAASGLRKSIEEQVAEMAGPDAADELRAANRAYGYLADIQPLAQEESTRQLARQPWYSPATIGSVAAGVAGGQYAGGPAGGAAGALLPLIGRAAAPRAWSTLATGARALGPKVEPTLTGLAPAAAAGVGPIRPSLDEREQDAITAFVEGGI